MRILVPGVSLLLTVFSIVLDFTNPSSDSPLCLSGLCRMDQVFASIDSKGVDVGSMRVLLDIDPSNPSVWCAYGELLAARGEVGKASAVFEQAVSLGPNISPVLMRAVNFDFTHDRVDHGLLLGARLLQQVTVFDEILFSYFLRSGVPVPRLLETAVPSTPRVARAWLVWVQREGTDQNLRDTWSWMKKKQLLDQESAANLTLAFWQRQSYQMAQEVWGDWIHARDRDYLQPERLSNRLFQDKPSGSPFDWSLGSPPSVEVARNDGLEIHFSGTENVNFSHIRQFATVAPGRYRFSAEVRAETLTTDQGPFFHIYDADNPGRVNAATAPIKGTLDRSWISVEFGVPASTQLLAVQLDRTASEHFDSKISGTLHVYRVSLAPSSSASR
jgi:hypothetical protein